MITFGNTRPKKMVYNTGSADVDVKRIYLGNTLVWGEQLPTGYTRLSYLETDGAAFINTHILSRNVDTISGTAAFTTFGEDVIYIAGGRRLASTTGKVIGYAVYAPTHGGFNYYPLAWNDDAAVNIEEGEVFTFNTFIGTSDLTFKVNGVLKDTGSVSVDKGSTSGSRTVYLFALNTSNTPQYCGTGTRIYELLMYFEGDKIANYIPAMRDSDGVVGMYDLVTDVFLTNAGTGAFSYGQII